MAGVFWPKTLVEVSDASWIRLAAISGSGTIAVSAD
jgi:hypothetical protein